MRFISYQPATLKSHFVFYYIESLPFDTRILASVSFSHRYGQTALHAIARDWHTDIASFFLEHGAVLDKADKYGRTPLHLAASVDHYQMVEFLVLNGGKTCCCIMYINFICLLV